MSDVRVFDVLCAPTDAGRVADMARVHGGVCVMEWPTRDDGQKRLRYAFADRDAESAAYTDLIGIGVAREIIPETAGPDEVKRFRAAAASRDLEAGGRTPPGR